MFWRFLLSGSINSGLGMIHIPESKQQCSYSFALNCLSHQWTTKEQIEENQEFKLFLAPWLLGSNSWCPSQTKAEQNDVIWTSQILISNSHQFHLPSLVLTFTSWRWQAPQCKAAHIPVEMDPEEFILAHGTSRFLRPEKVQDLKRKGKTGLPFLHWFKLCCWTFKVCPQFYFVITLLFVYHTCRYFYDTLTS